MPQRRISEEVPLTAKVVNNAIGDSIADLPVSGGPATFSSVTDSGLTSGRVAIIGTGGLLADDAGLTYDAGTNTLTTTTVVANLTGNASGSSGSCTGNSATVTNGVYTTGAGTVFLAPNGSAASLTSFPTLNQNTTGTASNITAYTINQNVGSSDSPSFTAVTAGTLRANTGFNHNGVAGATGTILVGSVTSIEVNGGIITAWG